MRAHRSLLGLLATVAIGCADPSTTRPGWPDGAFDASGAEVNWRETPRPWIIGHRGTGADDEAFGENTIAAMLHAIVGEGAVGVEIDVMLTRDLEVVVHHDPRLDRTTNCMGCVSDRTLVEVQECSVLLGEGAPPSLAAAVDALMALPVEPLIMLDAKLAPMDGCPVPTPTTDEQAATLGRRIGEVLASANAARTAGIQSSSSALLEAARAAAPGVLTLVADTDMADAVATAGAEHAHGVAVGLEKLEEHAVRGARASELLIDTFVVNAPVDLATAVLYDADVLETDDVPDILEAFADD